MREPLTLLGVFPHPDDETLGMGSTFARYAAEGRQTCLVCATRGERGWNDSQGPNPGLDGLARIREGELQCAAEHLGIHEVHFLDYIDGDLDQAEPAEVIGKLVTHLRRIRPHVVVTFGPDGVYGHPDHVAISQFTSAALVCAADRNFVDASVQPPHRVLKFYYLVDSVEMVNLSQEAFGGIRMDVDGVTREHVGWEDWQITTRLDNRRFMDKMRQALLCYQSQLPGFGPLAQWSTEQLTHLFGMGYFYRAFSLVNSGRTIETDLFDGLR